MSNATTDPVAEALHSFSSYIEAIATIAVAIFAMLAAVRAYCAHAQNKFSKAHNEYLGGILSATASQASVGERDPFHASPDPQAPIGTGTIWQEATKSYETKQDSDGKITVLQAGRKICELKPSATSLSGFEVDSDAAYSLFKTT